jgi:cytochrome c553
MKARLIAAIAAGLTLVSVSAVAGGNVERGRVKAEQVCASCHAAKTGAGFDWNKPLQPEYPLLAGQHYDYLVTSLNSYKAGDKSLVGRKNAIMAGQAAGLSKQEIQDLSAFFAAMKGPLHVKR